MKSFKKYLSKIANKTKTARFFDLDNTLVYHPKIDKDKSFNIGAVPIKKSIKKLNKAVDKLNYVTIVTARNPDDTVGMNSYLKNKGVNTDIVPIQYSDKVEEQTPDAKAKIVSKIINSNGYSHAHMYDDHHENLYAFLNLKSKHPEVKFIAHHVKYDPYSDKTKIKRIKV